jgi:hypothetical protein
MQKNMINNLVPNVIGNEEEKEEEDEIVSAIEGTDKFGLVELKRMDELARQFKSKIDIYNAITIEGDHLNSC